MPHLVCLGEVNDDKGRLLSKAEAAVENASAWLTREVGLGFRV